MKKKFIKTRKFADGSEITIDVFHFSGTNKDSPSVYIQSGIHGSEIQGYLVCLNLIDFFRRNPPLGNVTIVPLSNPYALNCKIGEYTFGRFDPVTGDNWNRNYIDFSYLINKFTSKLDNISIKILKEELKKEIQSEISKRLKDNNLSYSNKICLQIQKLASAADIVIDLHCDTKSIPHVYCSQHLIPSVRFLGIPHVVEIPPIFNGALDEAIFCPWVKLIKLYNSLNNKKLNLPVESFTIELGNQEKVDKIEASHHMKNILNYLGVKNIISKAPESILLNKLFLCKLEDFRTIYSPCGGIIIQKAKLGIPLKTRDNVLSISVPQKAKDAKFFNNVIIKENPYKDSIPITYCSSPIINEGMAIIKMMSQYKVHRYEMPEKVSDK